MVPGVEIPHPKTNMTGWNIHHLKMYFLLNMGIFQCHVSFQFMVGAIFVGTFKGISKDSAEFSQAWFKKKPPCQPFQNGDFEFIWSQQRNGVGWGLFLNWHGFFFGGQSSLELNQLPPIISWENHWEQNLMFGSHLFSDKNTLLAEWCTA